MGCAARLTVLTGDSAGLTLGVNSCLLIKLMRRPVLLTCLSLVMLLGLCAAVLGLPSGACSVRVSCVALGAEEPTCWFWGVD